MSMTILYKSDFKRYPKAIIDVTTKNRTWVEFASKLKAMGIENWGFHLTLLDPGLKGIDPRDPNLDNATILRIQHELRNNYWYFLREIFRVPSTTGGDPGYLEANRGNIATYWSVFNHFITYLEQIRQTGKSLTGRSLMTGVHTAWTKGSTSILFTKSDLRPDEIKDYKAIKADLPGYLWYNTPKDKDNQQDFTTLCHGNVTFSYIPSVSEDAANKIGRGKTPIWILADEVPFLSYCYISIPSLIASTNRSFTDAERDGTFHGILYSTTAGDLSTKEGKYVYEKIRQVGMFFSEMLYDCTDREEARQLIFSNSSNKVAPHVRIAFNHLQLGYSNEWLKQKVGTVPASKDQIKRDYLGIWTFGSQENPIPEHLLNTMRRSENTDFTTERYNTYYVVRFHKPKEWVVTRKAVMGLDMSEAIGRDAITGVVIDIETLETLAAFSISESNLIYFGTFLSHFMQKFPNITLVPEAKSAWTGGIRDQVLIEMPKLGIDPGKRIYSTVVDTARGSESEQRDYRDYSTGYPSERKYYPYRSDFGFKTGKVSREVLYRDVMMNTVKEVPTLIRDPALIDELSTLVERKGRIDHALSGHDDHVVSFALAHWFIRYARNVDHYGIDSTRIMSNVIREMEVTPEEFKKRTKFVKLQQEMEDILSRLENSNSHIEIAYLESKLKMLERELPDVSEHNLGAGSLSARARESKDKRKGRNRNNLQPMFPHSPL